MIRRVENSDHGSTVVTSVGCYQHKREDAEPRHRRICRLFYLETAQKGPERLVVHAALERSGNVPGHGHSGLAVRIPHAWSSRIG